MRGNSEKKHGALISAAVIIALMTIFIVGFLLLIMGEEEIGVNWILLIYIGVFAAIIIGVLISLKQRFGEISSGEEDEAKRY